MDILKRIADQFQELFQTLSVSQRLTFLLVTGLVVGGFGYLMLNGTGTSGFTPISIGKSFSVEELIRAEEALIQAGLTNFERRGQRLLVPTSDVDRYNATLLAAGSLPQNWAEEWERQYADIGPFANNKQMDIRKEIARAKLASEILRGLPDVEYANVVWDQEEKARWPNLPRSTATVTVRPKSGRELSPNLIQSIRVSIAGMKANLSPNDVTVLDLGRQIAYEANSENDPFNDRLIQRVNQLKDMYRREILTAIDYIDQVRVAVNVDLEQVKSAIRRTQKVEQQGTPIFTTTQEAKQLSTQYPTTREPGQQSNAPLSLAAQRQPQQSEDINDKTESTLTAPSFEITQEDLIGAMPENVQVSIVIPETYFRVVAQNSGTLTAESSEQEIQDEIKKAKPQVIQDIKNRIAKIIPIPTGQPVDDFVDVGSFVASPKPVETVTVPWSQTLSYFVTQWGSGFVLMLFAIWAFWMLNRTVRDQQNAPALEEEEESDEDDELQDRMDEVVLESPDTGKRENLQNIVHDNPEMTATILTKWIQDAK